MSSPFSASISVLVCSPLCLFSLFLLRAHAAIETYETAGVRADKWTAAESKSVQQTLDCTTAAMGSGGWSVKKESAHCGCTRAAIGW
jgi:hypothetical protein